MLPFRTNKESPTLGANRSGLTERPDPRVGEYTYGVIAAIRFWSTSFSCTSFHSGKLHPDSNRLTRLVVAAEEVAAIVVVAAEEVAAIVVVAAEEVAAIVVVAGVVVAGLVVLAEEVAAIVVVAGVVVVVSFFFTIKYVVHLFASIFTLDNYV